MKGHQPRDGREISAGVNNDKPLGWDAVDKRDEIAAGKRRLGCALRRYVGRGRRCGEQSKPGTVIERICEGVTREVKDEEVARQIFGTGFFFYTLFTPEPEIVPG